MDELIKLFEGMDFKGISKLKRAINYVYDTKELAVNEEYLKEICTKIAEELNCKVKYTIKATYYECKDVVSYVIIDKREDEIDFGKLPYDEDNNYFTVMYEFNNSYLKDYLEDEDNDKYIITKPNN